MRCINLCFFSVEKIVKINARNSFLSWNNCFRSSWYSHEWHNTENNFFARRRKEKKKKKTLGKLSYHGYVGGFLGIMSSNVKHTIWIFHFNSFMHVAHAYSVSFYVLIKIHSAVYDAITPVQAVIIFCCSIAHRSRTHRKIKDFKCCVMTIKNARRKWLLVYIGSDHIFFFSRHFSLSLSPALALALSNFLSNMDPPNIIRESIALFSLNEPLYCGDQWSQQWKYKNVPIVIRFMK